MCARWREVLPEAAARAEGGARGGRRTSFSWTSLALRSPGGGGDFWSWASISMRSRCRR